MRERLSPFLFLLGTAAFLAVTAAVVYLAAAPSPRQPVRPGLTAEQGSPSGFGRFQPISTPPTEHRQGTARGGTAPSFSARRFDDGDLQLEDLRGQGVVLNFFASWCLPCREEARDLEATYRKYRARGIVFLAVNIEQDTWDDARGFLREFGITYPAVRDERGEIARKYQMFGLPTTYFIDKDGVIRSKFVGAFLGPEGLKELERRVETIVP